MHLTLTRCQISPPPIFKGFDRLINLKLRRAIISESLGSLISHCPLLENLELTYLDNSNPVEISAPKLKSFIFRGNIHIIHLNNVPLLSNVSYKPKEFSVEAEHDLGKIFEFIPALKNLWWKHDFVHDVHVGPAEVIPTRLPYALNRLKRLNICCITLGEFFDLSFALCLIRSSMFWPDYCVFKDIQTRKTVGYDESSLCGGEHQEMGHNQDMVESDLGTAENQEIEEEDLCATGNQDIGEVSPISHEPLTQQATDVPNQLSPTQGCF
ncbi:hypothetical protein MTR67_021466 [Solanum verrucosum]|uniref:F-box/LRR-repeat protein 15/At3g58940/PEG3-like LRR domain-containing protein n=1 Tax=Solanum verrucosum TaxID=315347 RepID=A0AAF0QRI7_SOLVR|nr:hypothetical protein MTR67_021466 [Solanum verrucosum]